MPIRKEFALNKPANIEQARQFIDEHLPPSSEERMIAEQYLNEQRKTNQNALVSTMLRRIRDNKTLSRKIFINATKERQIQRAVAKMVGLFNYEKKSKKY